MQAPQLLYHSDSPTLYPTNTSSSLITVRFPSPIRVSAIRITPEGVASPTGVGTTYPVQWTGEIFFNSSDANPVNALERREIRFDGGEWPVEYEVGMPEDVTTRLISLLAPVQNITLSIYGYHAAGPSSLAPAAHRIGKTSREDYSWVSAWAGGVDGLIDLLGSKSEAELKERAVECLELLEEGPGGIITKVLQRPSAIAYILHTRRHTLRDQILDDPKYALHPNVKSSIRTSHPLHPVVSSTGQLQRKAAWRNLDVGLSLHILAQGEATDLLEFEEGMEKSNLSRLLELAEGYARGRGEAKKLELILDILDAAPPDPVLVSHLAQVVPRLLVSSNLKNKSNRSIKIPTAYSTLIARSLLLSSTDVIKQTLALPMARQLVQPFLPHLPSDSPYHTLMSPRPNPSPAFNSATADTRRLSRLAASLISPAPSSIVHTATPAELVTILAPALYALLSTAPFPLLDIPSALANPTPESQASAWAGKVYSSNEFRDREEARVGLGIKGAKTGQGSQGNGQGQGVGNGGIGEGLQPGPGRISRPASRHVDDFGR